MLKKKKYKRLSDTYMWGGVLENTHMYERNIMYKSQIGEVEEKKRIYKGMDWRTWPKV